MGRILCLPQSCPPAATEQIPTIETNMERWQHRCPLSLAFLALLCTSWAAPTCVQGKGSCNAGRGPAQADAGRAHMFGFTFLAPGCLGSRLLDSRTCRRGPALIPAAGKIHDVTVGRAVGRVQRGWTLASHLYPPDGSSSSSGDDWDATAIQHEEACHSQERPTAKRGQVRPKAHSHNEDNALPQRRLQTGEGCVPAVFALCP